MIARGWLKSVSQGRGCFPLRQAFLLAWVTSMLWSVPDGHAGSILREVFQNIGGTSLGDLTNNPAFPNKPTITNFVTGFFEAPVDAGDNYGTRMHGYVVPPVTGNYTFWVASDDNGALFLSSDEDPSHQKLICKVSQWTASRAWGTFPEQMSAPIPLQAGKAYYISALQKEGGGGDNLAVRWLRPDGKDEGPIPASFLLPYGTSFTPPMIDRQPTNQTVVEGAVATLTVVLKNQDLVTATWRRNGQVIPGETGLSIAYGPVSLNDDGAVFTVGLTNRLGGTNSAEVILAVTPDVTPPRVLSVVSLGATHVQVGFSEGVGAATALVPSHYTLDGGASVLSAVSGPDNRSVILVTSPLRFGSDYLLGIAGVTDLARTPNVVASGSPFRFRALEFVSQDVGTQDGQLLRVGDGAFEVTGKGGDIGGVADQMQFCWQSIAGSFDLQVRIDSTESRDPFFCAGLVGRTGLEPGSVFAGSFLSSPEAGVFFRSRNSRDAAAVTSTVPGGFPANAPNGWLRLKRAGNVLTGYASIDGVSWTTMGSVSVALPSTMYVGLAVSSGMAGTPMTASFREYGPTRSTLGAVWTSDREPIGPTSRRTGLVFSEIMYHPRVSASETRDLTYVELYNADSLFEDLDGWQIDGGIRHRFPAGFRLEAGACVVVAADPDAIRAVYGIRNVVGPFEGRLSHSGARLRLLDGHGAVKLDLVYGTESPWPVAADGAGPSLVLARPSYGEADGRAWGASEAPGGSPGRFDSLLPNPQHGVVINEFLAHGDGPHAGFIELYNRNPGVVDLSGCFLSDSAVTNRFRIPDGTVIAGGGVVVFEPNELGFRLRASGATIFLVSSNGSRVIDAVRFPGQENGVASGRSPDGADTVRRLANPTPGMANAPRRAEAVVINEIMADPISGDSDDEYVELYNLGASDLDLTGWKLSGGIQFSFPNRTLLKSEAYLVVARNKGRLLGHYPQLNVGNTVGDYQGSLGNHGDLLRLEKPDQVVTTNGVGGVVTNDFSVVVFEVRYGVGGGWGRYAAGGGSSLELVDPRADPFLGSNWMDSDESQKAPWTTVEATGVLDNSITTQAPNRLQVTLQGEGGELMLDDVEVFKAGGTNLLVNGGFESGAGVGAVGWTFAGNHSFSTVEQVGAASGVRALHLRGQGKGDSYHNAVRAGLGAGLAPNVTATIRAKVRWMAGTREVLFRLRGNGLELPARMDVPWNLGTPGLPNSRRVANAGPAIYEISHLPVLPQANQPVTVRCRVSDPDGVQSVILRVRLDPGSTVTTLAMRDDGTGGDAVAGDGIYSATISGRAAGVVIGFKIQAIDGLGSAGVFPATGLLPQGAPSLEAYVRWGDPVPVGTFAHYHLWNSQATDQQRTNALSNLYRDATLVYGDFRVLYNVGFRDKGSPYHGGGGSYSVINPEESPLLGDTERIFRTTGNGGVEDTGLRNQLGSWLGKQMGIPHLYSHYMRLYRNGQIHENISQDEEYPSPGYAKSWFPSSEEGDLYKLGFLFEFAEGGGSFDALGATMEAFRTTGRALKLARYRWCWQGRGYLGTANNYTNVFELIGAANDSSAAFLPNLQALVDLEEWMRVMAYNRIMGNWDAYGYGGGQNMYAYKRPGSPWTLMPWDIDFTFGLGGGPTEGLWGGGDPVLNKWFDVPAIRRMLWRAYQQAVAGPLQAGAYAPVLEARRSILARNGVTGLTSPTGVAAYLEQRRSYIAAQIQANDAPTFVVTSNSGKDYTSTTPATKITGRAPFAAVTLAVNGVAYPVTWTDPTTFALTIPLLKGTNAIRLSGLDASGSAITNLTTTFKVVFNGVAALPQDNVVINEIHYQALESKAEFVELHNRSTSVPHDLSGWRLDGLGYTFPSGTILGGNSYLVLARNRAALHLAYGSNVPVFDEYPGTLDPGGEELRLVKPGSGLPGAGDTVISEVRYSALPPWPANARGSGASLQLVDPGQPAFRVANWASPDPADPNRVTPARLNAAVRQALDPFPSVWINEVMPDNRSGPRDGHGESDPFLELYNSGFEAVDMSPFFLTDTYTNLTRWAFPSGTVLSPGGFLVVWADGQPTQSSAAELHSTFRLNPTNGSIALVRMQGSPPGPAVMDYLDYHGVGMDRSLGDVPDGNFRTRNLFYFPTPGGTNNPGFPRVLLRINEIMASNTSTVLDPATGRFEDWFELYNGGTESVELAGYSLSVDPARPRDFVIPAGVRLVPGGFLLVWADKSPAANGRGGSDLHVGFKLSKAGGELGLFAPDGTEVDRVVYGPQEADVSLGLLPDGFGGVALPLPRASPGVANVEVHPGVLRIEAVVVGANGVQINWMGEAGVHYRLESKDDLLAVTWTVVAERTGGAGPQFLLDPGPGGRTQRFYRLVRTP